MKLSPLLSQDEESYGSNYKNHLIEQYKLYVEMADRISSRRLTASSFFLSINTALISILGFIKLDREVININYLVLLMCFCGMILSYLWYRLTRSYRDLNFGKFQVIHKIEELLPIRPYEEEWNQLGQGKDRKKYLPFTHIEVYVPWVFLGIYLIIILYSLYSLIC